MAEYIDPEELAKRAHFMTLAQNQSFTTKDSGKRQEYESGMVRDTNEGKARPDLLFPLGVPYEAQFMTRVARLLSRGAEKYEPRNWERANSWDEYYRARESTMRHIQQWISGETDEDHAAAAVFGLLTAETIKWKIDQR